MILIIRKLAAYNVRQWLCLLIAVFIMSACTTTPSKKTATPQQDEAYVRQSIQYMYAGRLDEALKSITKALQLNPKSADAYTVAGLIYNKNSQSDLAERYFSRALSIQPDHSAAQTNYASFLCKHDQPLKAEKLFLAAAKNSKNSQPDVAYTNAGLCVLGIPDTVKANDYFSQALRINPNSPVPLYQLAKIQYSSYEYEKALQFLKAYEKIARPTPKTLLLGAQIGEAIQNLELANSYKILLAQQFPNSPEAKQVLSEKLNNFQQQPAVYDVRELLDDNVAN